MASRSYFGEQKITAKAMSGPPISECSSRTAARSSVSCEPPRNNRLLRIVFKQLSTPAPEPAGAAGAGDFRVAGCSMLAGPSPPG